MLKKVVIVGSGNAALSAGIAALEKGAEVTIYEKADKTMAGGNTKYTAGAMRFAYEKGDQLLGLLENPNDKRIKRIGKEYANLANKVIMKSTLPDRDLIIMWVNKDRNINIIQIKEPIMFEDI